MAKTIDEQLLDTCREIAERSITFGSGYRKIKEAISLRDRELREKIEAIPLPEVDEDFNDGGDDEYRNRRIAVESAKRGGFNEAKCEVLSLLSPHNKENER